MKPTLKNKNSNLDFCQVKNDFFTNEKGEFDYEIQQHLVSELRHLSFKLEQESNARMQMEEERNEANLKLVKMASKQKQLLKQLETLSSKVEYFEINEIKNEQNIEILNAKIKQLLAEIAVEKARPVVASSILLDPKVETNEGLKKPKIKNREVFKESIDLSCQECDQRKKENDIYLEQIKELEEMLDQTRVELETLKEETNASMTGYSILPQTHEILVDNIGINDDSEDTELENKKSSNDTDSGKSSCANSIIEDCVSRISYTPYIPEINNNSINIPNNFVDQNMQDIKNSLADNKNPVRSLTFTMIGSWVTFINPSFKNIIEIIEIPK
jgi:hypothetical protein